MSFVVNERIAYLTYGKGFNRLLYLAYLPDGVPVVVHEPGVRIWDYLLEGAAVSEIAQLLSEDYEMAPGELIADIQDFVDNLHSQGFLRKSVE